MTDQLHVSGPRSDSSRALLPVTEVLDSRSVAEGPHRRILALARSYPVDRLLAVFRRNASVDEHGALPPGGWEDFGHPQEEAWNEWEYPGAARAQTANLLRGHYAGHFLSMAAFAAHEESDPTLAHKVEQLVAGLGEVQEALAATGRYSHPGFLAAYGEWQFSRLEEFAAYKEIWAPYYTAHKIMAGLLDAYEYVGSSRALEIATAMAEWVDHRLSRLSEEHRQKMWAIYIAGEFGGMNDALARLADITGEHRFRRTAQYFDQTTILDMPHTGDCLNGMHANQHLPQLLGYLRLWDSTGDPRYLEATITAWHAVVPGRMFAHGGTGASEVWGAPGAVAGTINSENAETCATYNLIKIASQLFAHTRDPEFLDYVERARVNQILGSRSREDSLTSPDVTYMFPVHPGAVREYGNVGTCCGGTGLENHVSYGRGAAYTDGADLWLGQYFPGQVSWAAAGLLLTLETDYPVTGDVTIRMTTSDGTRAPSAPAQRTLYLRIPRWTGGDATLAINGVPQALPSGDFAALRRVWADGDNLTVHLPMAFRTEATPDDPAVVSLFYGPTLLLAQSDTDHWLTLPSQIRAPEEVSDQLRAGHLTYGDLEWEPCWWGGTGRYHMYVRRPGSRDYSRTPSTRRGSESGFESLTASGSSASGTPW